ncbi:adenylyl-sulfate kinase [Candidatus Enterovibrio escicola]|uniref:Adenylyl-sulfate kinase n=1 Tax=Candidatus Enterovibrio escicola TaxID=1927127 RepID=A0A2A5T1X9_9GAMM|nr:adenylyl-sulfate kinase [Candidatus Enterovibrio escacola]PCS22140.1 Adenylylsulfate kinase [Candidatus Enterovibrio escacola]
MSTSHTSHAHETVVWHQYSIDKKYRAKQKKQHPALIWFTGLSGSGKSTIAGALEIKLAQLGHHTYLLDGDNVRLGLCRDLGFSYHDRCENIRRVGEVAKLMMDSGLIVLSAFVSPFYDERQLVRESMADGEFLEIFVDTPLEVCEARDPKGLYKKVRSGEIKAFTGISSVYEAPKQPDIHLHTDQPVDMLVEQCLAQLRQAGFITLSH